MYDIINDRTSTEIEGTITVASLQRNFTYCNIHMTSSPVCTLLVILLAQYHTHSCAVVTTGLRDTTDLPRYTTEKSQNNQQSLTSSHLTTTCLILTNNTATIIGRQFFTRQRPLLVFTDTQFLRKTVKKCQFYSFSSQCQGSPTNML